MLPSTVSTHSRTYEERERLPKTIIFLTVSFYVLYGKCMNYIKSYLKPFNYFESGDILMQSNQVSENKTVRDKLSYTYNLAVELEDILGTNNLGRLDEPKLAPSNAIVSIKNDIDSINAKLKNVIDNIREL